MPPENQRQNQRRNQRQNQQPDSSDQLTNLVLFAAGVLLFIGVFGVYFKRIGAWFEHVTTAVNAPSFSGIYTTVMIIFILLDAFLLFVVIYAVRRYRDIRMTVIADEEQQIARHQERQREQPITATEEVGEVWKQVQTFRNSKNPAEWNMAVLRADALLDEMLQHSGYAQGETMADRLRVVDPTRVRSLDAVWSAHRLRNSIAHDPRIEHTQETINHALNAYEQALRELGVLDTGNSNQESAIRETSSDDTTPTSPA